MSKVRSKIKRPRNVNTNRDWNLRIDTADSVGLPFHVCGFWLSLKEIKRVHDWLGKAIEWKEANK